MKIEQLSAPLNARQEMIYNLLAGKEAYRAIPLTQDDVYTQALIDYIQSIKPPAKRTKKSTEE